MDAAVDRHQECPKFHRVALVTAKVDSLTFTLVKAMAFHGLKIEIYCDQQQEGGFSSRMDAIPGAQRRPFSESNEFAQDDARALLVQAHPFLPSTKALELARSIDSRAETLITGGDKGWPWRKAMAKQLHEWRSLRQAGIRVGRVVYKDGFRTFDLYRLLGMPRFICGFDVHSQFLMDPGLYDAIFHSPWDPHKGRSFRVSFLGCLDPRHRRGFLSSLRPLFQSLDMYWHEYSDSAGAGVSARDYVELLTDSDFVLCPPGYSLVTHRPLEALLRGAIPILNAAEIGLYEIGLKDQVNCIAVKNDRWRDAVLRALKLPKERLLFMRHRIYEMLDHIRYEKTSLSMCQRLGVL